MFTLRRRGIAARVGIVIAAVGAFAAMALPGASAATAASPSPSAAASASPAASRTTCVPFNGAGSQCTGTLSGDNAWNPWTGAQISHPPVVTVSQTKDLTDQVVNVSWQYFTPTLGFGQQPNPVGNGASPFFYEVNVFECKGTNPQVSENNGLADSCYEVPLGTPGVQAGIPNALEEHPAATGGVTLAPGAEGIPQTWHGTDPKATGGDPANWKGSAQFHIEAGAEENSQLGCDVNSPCSLVVDPNFGGDYDFGGSDVNTNTSQCEQHDFDDLADNDGVAPDTNAYDGFACQLMDRIVIPLSFAPTPDNCPQKNPQFFAEGSPMMERQMTQWEAGMCGGPAPVSLNYSSIAESQARQSFLQGGQAFAASTDMALVTLPPDAAQTSSRKFTYAPLANSGVAMAYYLDDPQSGEQINNVVLDPRLAAKLTTESYSLNYDCTVPPPRLSGAGPQWQALPKASVTCDPAVADNPRNVFDDQEFLALNKHCQPTNAPANYVCGSSDFPNDNSDSGNMMLGPFLPTVPSGNDDLTYQLTDWVAADGDAAAFLAGKKDLWGMAVNTNYKNIPYPTEFFQTLDPGTQYPRQPIPCSSTACSGGEWNETMNAAWNFVTGLDNMTNRLLEYQPSADNPVIGCQLTSGACSSTSQLGYSLLPPEGATSRDLFSELDLGDVGAYQFPATAMVNAGGDAVPPTQASVEAAVKDMKTNPDGITQFVNQSSPDPSAYPLAMVDYAMVPTCGLSSSEAAAIASFLTKAATSGQTQGNAPGELAPGYYPLTSGQKAQTLKAAREVKSQDCVSVPPDHTVSGHSGVSDVGGANLAGGRPGGAGTSNGATPAASARGEGAKPLSTSAKPPSSAIGRAQTAAFGQKSPDSGLSGVLLLIAIIVGGLALVGGPAAWVITVTGKWPAVIGFLRPVLTRLVAARTWLTGLLPTGRA